MVSLKDIYLLNRQINSIFDRNGAYDTATWTPFADVYESSAKYHVVLEIAGVTEDQITAETEGNKLRIWGCRKTKHEGYRYHQIERGCGGFMRLFEFPEPINPDEVEAVLKDGVLHIEIKKRATENRL